MTNTLPLIYEGKGENPLGWHGMASYMEQYERAMAELSTEGWPAD